MKYIEYGNNNNETIIFLHGGGLSWWNYKDEAKLLENDYHVVLPILDGHSNSDKDFTTIENNANDLINLINERFNGSVLLIGGLSLGAQILVEALSKKDNLCKYAIIESALVIPSKMMAKMIKPSIDLSYKLIKNKTFSKLQFNYLRINRKYFEDYYKDSCGISKDNLISFLSKNQLYSLKDGLKNNKTKTIVIVGEKENMAMKKSAIMIHNMLADSKIEFKQGLFHGEYSINHPKEYVDRIKELVNNK